VNRWIGIVGIVVLVGVAWLVSSNRRRFPLRPVVGGLALQWVFALLVLRTEIGRTAFDLLARGVTQLLKFSDAGSAFLFGNLIDETQNWGFAFAFKVLPTIIFFSSLTTIGYHLGLLQRLVGGVARVMRWSLRLSGAEALCAAANMFMGQTEAPLAIRPYIAAMTASELMSVMVGGFATVAGSAMAGYLVILGQADAAHATVFAQDLLAASAMSAPAAMVVAKIMTPETGSPETAGGVRLSVQKTTVNVVDAAATGAADGLRLALNVAGMLIAFIAIIAMLDYVLAAIGNLPVIHPFLQARGVQELGLDTVFGALFYPVAFLMGVPTADCYRFGSLLGEAMATNEFVAYISLADMIKAGQLSERSINMSCFALCGFANFSSVAIQIAGIGGMAPKRRTELARIGLKAMFGGAIACWMTGAIAGLLM
jgi:CNT family concentrative nucleoside transporter